MLPSPRIFPRLGRAFTLIELMVSTAILGVILLLVFVITQQTSDVWKSSAAKIELFQGARAAFESMTRRISQTTLNTYYDYFNNAGERRTAANTSTFEPARYGRYSDLHFITGKALVPTQVGHAIFFQATNGYAEEANYRGVDNTLNALGYFVEFGNDSSRPPFLETLAQAPPNRNRFRLMQFLQPTEDLSVYNYDPAQPASALAWFQAPVALSSDPNLVPSRPVRPLAENIVALVILPKRSEKDEAGITEPSKKSLASQYEYNSRPLPAAAGAPPTDAGTQPITENQLPPIVEVAMVAVDEPSFIRFNNTAVAPNLGLQPGPAQLFKDSSQLAPDLDKLEKVLLASPGNIAGNKIKLRYQIFRTNVPIRAAKWSE